MGCWATRPRMLLVLLFVSALALLTQKLESITEIQWLCHAVPPGEGRLYHTAQTTNNTEPSRCQLFLFHRGLPSSYLRVLSASVCVAFTFYFPSLKPHVNVKTQLW